MIVKNKVCLKFFFFGSLLGMMILVFGFYLGFELVYKDKTYPRITIGNLHVGNLTKSQTTNLLKLQNQQFKDLTFTFIIKSEIATLSGERLKVGLDEKLLADQAFLIGRSGNLFTALYQKFAPVNLSLSYGFDSRVLENLLNNLAQKVDLPAQEALFQFANNRVTAFKPSINGQALNKKQAEEDFIKLISPPQSGIIVLSTVIVEPKVKTQDANNLGIKELVGSGKSNFGGSIANRIYNLTLAASRLNGLLIAPKETFSFNQTVGEISDKTGYKPAYVIKEKRTVLDDGGGVCQVSTTLFRAALNTGLPIIERQGHAYRVAYYEQGGFSPGLDATVYAPTVDLKIKNDMANYLLMQTKTDTQNSRLTIDFYGTLDGRTTTVSNIKIRDQVKPPDDFFQDDPNLPKGQIKQIDWAAWGVKTSFDYKVTRGEEILQDRTFTTNFQPWQAIYLRGTRE